jgi:hypothetical protein
MMIGGSALRAAADEVIERGKRFAAHFMEAEAADIAFADGTFTIAGTDRSMPIEQVARMSFMTTIARACARPRLPPLARQPAQPGLRGQRPPRGDGARALPRLRIVGHTGEQTAQLDRGSELAALVEGDADGGGLGLGHDEHAGRMGGSVTPRATLTRLAPPDQLS